MRLFLSAACLSLVFGVAACGGASDAPAPATPSQTTQNTPAAPTPATRPAPAPAPAPAAGEPSPEFANLPEPYKSASYSIGKRVFKQCSSCHVAKPGPNLVGPNLHGMFDRKVGALDGYNYSKALQEADFDWTPEQLDSWLQSPQQFLSGNRMSFAGVRRERDRVAVIAYLMVETAK